MEDITEKFEGLQEFVLEQLSSFKRTINEVKSELQKTAGSIQDIKETMDTSMLSLSCKINILEERIENNVQAVNELKNSFHKPMEESDVDDEPIHSTPKESTPEPPRKFFRLTNPTPSSDVPVCLNDLQDEDLKQKLAAMEHTVKYIKDKEKLTYCQLVYVHYWFDNSIDKITVSVSFLSSKWQHLN